MVSLLLLDFRKIVRDTKRFQFQSAKKRFANANAKPNSRVANMVDKAKRQELLKLLVPSSATLLVVPSVLIEHWKVRLNCDTDHSITSSSLFLLLAIDSN
jgi:hypothetical protein